MVPVRVVTYSGYRADQYPLRFSAGASELEVVEIEDRWYDPSASYFRVFASDAQRYLLRQCGGTGEWQLRQCAAPQSRDKRLP